MFSLSSARNPLLTLYLAGAMTAYGEVAPGEDSYYKVLESIRVGDSQEALQEAASYLEKFPQGEHWQRLQALRLSVLFDQQEYQQIVALVQQIDPQELGNQQQSVSYMLVGAYCLSGAYAESVAAAEAYFSQWPAGRFTSDVRYFQAVSLARQGYVDQARSLFELILKSPARLTDYAPRARYELAFLDFKQLKYARVIKRLSQLLPTLVENELKVASGLLLAQAHAVLRDRESAERVYLEALQLAEESGLAEQQQEVLFYLIDFYARELTAGESNQQIEKAVPYYQEFFREFPHSRYAAQVAIVALPALEKIGQLEAGVKQLEDVVRHSCQSGEEAGLQRAAKGLVWKMLALGDQQSQLHQRWKAEGSTTFSIVMRHSLAAVYAAGIKQSQVTWGRKLRYTALRDIAYAELLTESAGAAMPAYVRADLGWWLLENGNYPERAKVLFKQAQKSAVLAHREQAIIGEAAALRLAKNVDLAEPLALLDAVIARNEQDGELLQQALYQKIEILHQLERWDLLSEVSREYLQDEKFTDERARVSYLLAKSYDKSGLVEDAIANYSRVFASYTRIVGLSAPAVDRLTRLTWQRNTPAKGSEMGDRQIAYQLGHRYLSLIENVDGWQKEQEVARSALGNIARNVATWEASGEVTPVAELLENLRKSRR